MCPDKINIIISTIHYIKHYVDFCYIIVISTTDCQVIIYYIMLKYIYFIGIDIIYIFVLCVLHLCDLIYFKIIFCEFCETTKYL